MSRNVRCGLIQASTALGGNRPLPEIKKAMIDKHLKLIEQAAKKKVQILCLQELFYGPYFCAEQDIRWYDLTERVPDGPTVKTRAKYLRVQVEADESMTGMKGPTKVNVRVPMQLLYAGVRLASLIPPKAHEQLDEALSKHGLPLTLSQIKPENLEELIDHLEDLTVDVDAKEDNTKVRVFCE